MDLNWSTPPAAPWIYNGDHTSASLCRGGVMWIFQRWHDLARPGGLADNPCDDSRCDEFYPLTRNVHAVVDDFGTLIPVE
jgi:hypothetical protein